MPRPTQSRVPIETPLFQEDLGPGGKLAKTLTQAWVRFFERTSSPVYLLAVFPISDTTPANNVGFPVPVLQPGPAIDISVVLKLVPTSGLELVLRRNTVRVGSIWIPQDTPAYRVISQDTFETKNLQFLENDMLTLEITQSDGAVDAGGVAVATVRWIAL